MPKMTFILKDGSRKEVEAPMGLSVLEIAHRNHVDIEGACEGSLACSTCHVVVEKEWFEKLAPASEDEEDMRDIAIELEDAHPDADNVNRRFTDLHKWVMALPGFEDDPNRSNEKILEAI